MSRLFSDIVNISYLASWLIVAVIVFRCVMKRAPKWMVCLMWERKTWKRMFWKKCGRNESEGS